MSTIKIFLIVITGMLLSADSVTAQKTPDKFINYLKKGDTAIALTLPGWFVRMGGRIASRSADTHSDSEIIKELTGHIKKLRFVVNENLPDDFHQKFAVLTNSLQQKGYEPLIEAREDGTRVNLWAEFDGNIVTNMVISVLEEDDTSVFFNIKSKIDIDKLKKTNFYQEHKKQI